MSKRKNRRRSPNLPEDTLARARRQAQQEDRPEQQAENAADDPAVASSQETPEEHAPPAGRQVRVSGARRTRRHARRTLETGVEEERHDSASIGELLAHPTKDVPEEVLRQQYSYVLSDLRSMGILAAALIIVLILVNLALI